jgi:hypothetical protein
MSGHWTEEYGQMLADCEKRESKLSDWERTFVDSLGQQLARGRTPTPKQTATLDAIWERVTG